MKIAIAVIAAFFLAPCYAGGKSFVVAAQRASSPVSVKLELAAEYIAVPVSISSSERDPLRNLENIQVAASRIADAVSKSSTVKTR